jgi:hypothetical protein
MVQPALRPVEMSDIPRPQSLADRIESAARSVPPPEATVSSMAERFAPDAIRAPRGGPERLVPNNALRWAAETRRAAYPTRGIVAVLTVVAIAPAAILAGLLWFGAIRGPEATLDLRERPGVPVQQAAVAATPALGAAKPAREIALTAPKQIAAKAGEAVDFAIAIDATEALPERSVIAVRGLPEGAAFSEGRPFGTNEWSLGPDEIDGLSLRLPEDQSGRADLRVEVVAADGAVLAHANTQLEVTAPDLAPGVVRPDEAGRVEDLIAHGDGMIAVGYFAGARAYFKRAAEAGSGEAALAVGATYDPAFIGALGIQGIKPDPAMAERWYARAAALSITDGEAKLAGLKRKWVQGDGEAAEGAAEPEDAAPAPLEQSRKATAAETGIESGPLGRLVAAAAELTSKDQWVEATNAVNIRADASSDGKVVKVVQKGTKLRVKGRDGNWIQVAGADSSEGGWIYLRFLKETDAP